MLKAHGKDHKSDYLRDFFLLESHETIESVRNMPKRHKAWTLLWTMKEEYENNGKTAKFFSRTNQLFQLILDNFLPTHPPTDNEMLVEIGQMFLDDINPNTCYNSTFATIIIRKALKDYQLPIIQAKLWKQFALEYVGLVMCCKIDHKAYREKRKIEKRKNKQHYRPIS